MLGHKGQRCKLWTVCMYVYMHIGVYACDRCYKFVCKVYVVCQSCMIHPCGEWTRVCRVCFAAVLGNTAEPRAHLSSVLWSTCDLGLSQLLGNIRISDLGLAVELKEGQDKTKGYAGTPGKI